MNIIHIIETILQQLGGRRFILMTDAKLSYGVNKKHQPYLRCLLPANISSGKGVDCFLVAYDSKQDLYQINLAHFNDGTYKIIKQIDNVCAQDLIPVFEAETGLYCTLATLI